MTPKTDTPAPSLLKRLRNQVEAHNNSLRFGHRELMREAATEIERLQAALRKCTCGLDSYQRGRSDD